MAPSTRNPTHGQKVDLGAAAPVTKEGPGAIAPDSLAAESRAFAEANDVSAEQISHQGKENFGSGSQSHHESGSHPHHKSHSARHGAGSESTSGSVGDGHHNDKHKDNKGNHKGLGSSGHEDKNKSGGKQHAAHDHTGTGSKTKGSKESHSHADPAPTYIYNVLGTNRNPHEGPHGKNRNASFSQFGTKADPGRLAEDNFALRASVGITESTAPRQKKSSDGNTPFDVLGSSSKA
ncbi:uncharacterized protein B0I36DRAFT_104118 [Microdochium trichocladiopsis]|uniref:Uncharacterized protein n=1 Tax=Microdochium trichocladiopsis TaxID=1682393 RepID=A0A9P9BRS4_9PEZI|nr:uncharacterized protein B0I36DRAFT_104118 [Microdochium trichocladiopsis]KAH7033028.1 hypothetical protein B0I36DRAFT_104118 [Microdochium trichocladiopsis]